MQQANFFSECCIEAAGVASNILEAVRAAGNMAIEVARLIEAGHASAAQYAAKCEFCKTNLGNRICLPLPFVCPPTPNYAQCSHPIGHSHRLTIKKYNLLNETLA